MTDKLPGISGDIKHSLEGTKILVTSGPTRAYLDRIRYLSNTSTGELGSLIACECARRGAKVIFVYCDGSKKAEGTNIYSREILEINELESLLREVLNEEKIHGIAHAMAVLDYIPGEIIPGKKPSGKDPFRLTLVPAPKLIKTLRQCAPEALLVSFKLEVDSDDETLKERAYVSLKKYGSDFVVANDLNRISHGIHPALVINPSGNVVAAPGTKQEIAINLADLFEQAVSHSSNSKSQSIKTVNIL